MCVPHRPVLMLAAWKQGRCAEEQGAPNALRGGRPNRRPKSATGDQNWRPATETGNRATQIDDLRAGRRLCLTNFWIMHAGCWQHGPRLRTRKAYCFWPLFSRR
ncbi:hypothetical protein BDZ91DRAFT_720420 [Kalaharituber pfeilii]|nr:hypothetical protein BDZ91DRAFT_720420 [Kalaharituber pfeilii]